MVELCRESKCVLYPLCSSQDNLSHEIISKLESIRKECNQITTNNEELKNLEDAFLQPATKKPNVPKVML